MTDYYFAKCYAKSQAVCDSGNKADLPSGDDNIKKMKPLASSGSLCIRK